MNQPESRDQQMFRHLQEIHERREREDRERREARLWFRAWCWLKGLVKRD